MDPQLLARLQQMMGGSAQPPPMGGGGGLPAGLAGMMGGGGFAGPPSGGFPGGMPFRPPVNAGPMPAPPGGGMNMPMGMGTPSGGWPLGLASQSGRPPPDPVGPNPPKPNQPPKPVPGSKPPKPPAPTPPAPAAAPVNRGIGALRGMQSVGDIEKYIKQSGMNPGAFMSMMLQAQLPGGGGGAAIEQLWGQLGAMHNQNNPPPAPKPKPKPAPKPKPTPDGRPPPGPTGGQGTLSGPNPMITPAFRHLFSNADVAKYGIQQPQYINTAYYDDKGLHWTTGVRKKWWEPNNPIEWQNKNNND